MFLEPKYIAPYIPYGLKGYVEHTDELATLNIKSGLNNVCDLNDFINGTYQLKPILRPISDYKLFEDILDEISMNDEDLIDENPDLVLRLPYEVVEAMIRNHIDVFNLIANDLAINLHTFKK